jgi:2-oxoglutarate dehydrogenase E2 component (dihydrolipoamide succinyltransferase)
MLVEVKVPQLSESVAEATLLIWHRKEGEAVGRDENLIDIETDKVVLELPAPADGVLVRIIKGDASTVVAGEVIATIDTEARPTATAAAPVTVGAQAGVAAPAGVRPEPRAVPATPVPSARDAREDARLMPAARKIVEEHAVDPTRIAGSGRDGRITKSDVLEHLSRTPSAPAAVTAPAQTATERGGAQAARAALSQPASPVNIEALLGNRPEQRVPMSRLRARIAERLVQSQSTAAILTTFNEVNMQPVMDLRKKHGERFEKNHGVRLGFMSFFVKAAVYALKKYPVVNASIDGNDIIYHGYFDIGVAVGSPRGLVVPILRDADQYGFADIEKRIADFGKRAQEGKLTIEELTGGTFSISNGGVYGSMLSTPIINPPQAAILGVHATKERAVVEAGQIVVRPMNYLALSYDHRIIDGREAVLSLVAIKEALEDPARLLLDL